VVTFKKSNTKINDIMVFFTRQVYLAVLFIRLIKNAFQIYTL